MSHAHFFSNPANSMHGVLWRQKMEVNVHQEYRDKVIAECNAALEAVGMLNFSVMTLYRSRGGQIQYRQFQDEVFQAIGGFLTSAGNLSCLLWPDKSGRYPTKAVKINIMSHSGNMEAAKYLRRCLRIDKRHILHKRWLKNSFAEKMRALNQHSQQDRIFHIVGAYLPFSGQFMSEIAFLYDPLSRKIQYGEEMLDIQEIAGAVYHLKRSLEEEPFQSPKRGLRLVNLPKGRIAA